MHESIFQDFDIEIRADDRPFPLGIGGVALESADPSVSILLVRLTHRDSGTTKSFHMSGVLAGMDRLLELHIRRLFPHSVTALQLEHIAGTQQCRLNENWRSGLARKVNLALMGLCDSPGATFWWHQLQNMPRVLVLMMYRRTESRFEALQGELAPSLAQFACAMRTSWTEVLLEATGLDGWRDVKLTELHRKGWPVETLEPRTQEQLAAIARCARTAHMALPYLADQDWRRMLGFVLEMKAARQTEPETETC